MSPREQFIAFMTILVKEIRRYTRIWTQTLLPSAITMSWSSLSSTTLPSMILSVSSGPALRTTSWRSRILSARPPRCRPTCKQNVRSAY